MVSNISNARDGMDLIKVQVQAIAQRCYDEGLAVSSASNILASFLVATARWHNVSEANYLAFCTDVVRDLEIIANDK